MQIPVSQYRDWIDKRKDPGSRKHIAHAALDAYETLVGRTSIKPHELEPIVAAAKSPYLVAWDIGTEFLIRLAEANPTAQEAIRDIVFNSHKVNERFQMVASIRIGVPEELCLQIIRRALTDKGNRVREKAAEAADRMHLKELLPELENCLVAETHPNTRQSLEMHIAMLRDGYLLEKDEEGKPRLTVRTKNGWSSPSITQKDIDEGRLHDKIKEMQCKDQY